MKKPPSTDPTIEDDLAFLRKCLGDIPSTKLAAKSTLAYSTICKLRKPPSNGGTRYPRYSTIKNLFRLAGIALLEPDTCHTEPMTTISSAYPRQSSRRVHLTKSSKPGRAGSRKSSSKK